jgi:hypothetical protein
MVIGVKKMAIMYSTRQAARQLRINAATLQQMIWRGQVREPDKSPAGHFYLDAERY